MGVEVKEIRRFKAQSDDGEIYEIIEFVNIITTNIGGRRVSTKGTTFHTLADSRRSPLNEIDSKTFKIVHTDETIRKIG